VLHLRDWLIREARGQGAAEGATLAAQSPA
jgi:hypothetical protein